MSCGPRSVTGLPQRYLRSEMLWHHEAPGQCDLAWPTRRPDGRPVKTRECLAPAGTNAGRIRERCQRSLSAVGDPTALIGN
jgi:hypothetical protein